MQGDDRYFIGHVGISAVNMTDVLLAVDKQVRASRPAYICVANVRTTVLSQKKMDYCRIQNESLLTIPDGMPLVWYAWLAGYGNVGRVTGPDLMIRLLELSEEKSYSHYFIGDTQETLERMKTVIAQRYGNVRIVGMHSPPFRPLADEEVISLANEINSLNPTFLWIALGAPKQEELITRMMPRLQSVIVVGVGAAFRFLLGEYRHPHPIIQMIGLEGVYWRFFKNPVKEARWYMYHIPAFGKLICAMLCKRVLKKIEGRQ